MSKLIDMLRRGKGEITEVITPLVDPGSAGGQAAGARFQSEGVSLPESSARAETAAPPIVAAPARVEPSAGEPRVERPSVSGSRTLTLRIPAPSPLLPFGNRQWRPSEQYRVLRTKISQHRLQPSLIVITSPGEGDGKTVSAINTAAALALKRHERVLLLDGDLRKSTVHSQLGLPKSPGLADVLEGARTTEEAVVQTQEFPNLYVMTSGVPPANPVELLDSPRWRALCAQLRGMFRYVIIDSPPVGGIADYELIQAVCDGVILVLRPDFTHRALCLNALQLMPESKFLGALLNCVPDWWLGKHAGAGYYYYPGEKARASSESAAAAAQAD